MIPFACSIQLLDLHSSHNIFNSLIICYTKDKEVLDRASITERLVISEQSFHLLGKLRAKAQEETKWAKPPQRHSRKKVIISYIKVDDSICI
jgi:hypothetical protein